MNNTHTQRELKFRVWDKDSKKWGVARLEDKGWCILDNAFDAVELSYWQQYTGFKDKNGKEIYEGGYVRGADGIYEVVWCNGAFKFLSTKSIVDMPIDIWVHEELFLCGCRREIRLAKFEVIGNVLENPELIEKE